MWASVRWWSHHLGRASGPVREIEGRGLSSAARARRMPPPRRRARSAASRRPVGRAASELSPDAAGGPARAGEQRAGGGPDLRPEQQSAAGSHARRGDRQRQRRIGWVLSAALAARDHGLCSATVAAAHGDLRNACRHAVTQQDRIRDGLAATPIAIPEVGSPRCGRACRPSREDDPGRVGRRDPGGGPQLAGPLAASILWSGLCQRTRAGRSRATTRSRSRRVPGSPFARLHDLDSRILLIGVGFNRCTALHFAESLVARRRTMTVRFSRLEGGGANGSRCRTSPTTTTRTSRSSGRAISPLGERRKRRSVRRGPSYVRMCDLVDFARDYFDRVL